MKDYSELSALALEHGNAPMHRLLQRQLNDLYLEYLAWSFLDGVWFMLPHVLAMYAFSLMMPEVGLPLSLPWLGSRLPVLLWYPPAALAAGLLYRRLRRGRRPRPPRTMFCLSMNEEE